MFDLFRFVMLRPAVPVDRDEVISTASDSDFQQQLERDRERPAPAPPMEATANQFLEGQHAVSKVSSLEFAAAYDDLAASLRAATPSNRAALLTTIKNASGLEADDLIDEQRFKDDRQRLADTLIAAKLGTPRSDFPLDLIARNLRLIALIQRAADEDKRLDDAQGIEAALNASIALPDKLLPLDIPLAAPWPEGAERPPGEHERPGDEHRRKAGGAPRVPRALRRTRLPERPGGGSVARRRHVGSAHCSRGATAAASRRPPPEREVSNDQVFREFRELREAVLKARPIAEGAVASGLTLTSARIFQGTTLKIRREALAEAPQTVHAGLRAARVDAAVTSISDAVDRINARRRELAPLVIDDLIGVSCKGESNVSQIGSQFVPTCRVPDLKARAEGNDHG